MEQKRQEAEVQREQAELARKAAEEELARVQWNAFFESKTMDEIACMTGLEFETFLARLLSLLGYTNIVLTPINDQGGDIICNCTDDNRVVIQAKRWSQRVGNSAVQELLGAMVHYECQSGMVITNSFFTEAAKALASKDPRIALFDGRWLERKIEQYLPPEIPPFDWARYNEEVLPAIVFGTPVRRPSMPKYGASRRRKRYRRRYR